MRVATLAGVSESLCILYPLYGIGAPATLFMDVWYFLCACGFARMVVFYYVFY